jgi:hypothetical protein
MLPKKAIMDKKTSDRSMLTRPNSLSQQSVKTMLINVIQQYKQHMISLEALTSLSEMILTSKNIVLSENLRKVLEEIKSLSIVNRLLTDILEELIEEKE